MQRVDRSLVHRAVGREQRLPSHLASEDPLAHVVGTLTTKYAVFDPLEVQQFHQVIHGGLGGIGFAHLPSVPVDRSTRVDTRATPVTGVGGYR